MRQVPVIAAAAVGLALLGSATHAGCAIGKDQVVTSEAIELLASRPDPSGWLVDGLATIPAGTGSINAVPRQQNSDGGCWFDLDLPRCERP